MKNKKMMWLILGALVLVIFVVGIVMALDKKSDSDTAGEQAPDSEKPVEDVEKPTFDDEPILKNLPEGSWELQDNTITDTWGVVLQYDQLPESLQGAESYLITVDGQTYPLTLNKYNDNVYNGEVSSVEHTTDEIEAGTIEAVKK